MSKTGKILGFGALGLTILSGLKSSKSKSLVQDTAPVSFAGSNGELDLLVNKIKTNGAIRTLLKGDKGDNGTKGDTGETGLAGDIVQNFGGSLLKNGALELGDAQNWTGGVIGENNGVFKSLEITQNVRNGTYPPLNPDILYKISFEYKSQGSFNVGLYSLDEENNDKDKGNGGFVAFQSTIPASNNFVKNIQYIGGVGLSSSNLSVIGKKIALAVINVSTNVKISKLILKEVDLGEPVPYTLPYLPVGQMVYDPADSTQLGRFDGTNVNWYTPLI